MQCALFLCSNNAAAIARLLPEDWQEQPESIAERIAFLQAGGYAFSLDAIFPFAVPLSDGMTKEAWLLSMLQQPALFLRVRKLQEHMEAMLVQKEIPFNWLTDTCLELPNGTPVQELFPEDAYVVQDASSQATGDYFQPEPDTTWWDCCAGAGGKSLLLCDLEPEVKLTVSDKRSSILHNLKQRFMQYRLAQPKAIVTDVADGKALENAMSGRRFDAIICDAPCTGSGTWARTPEQLYFFKEDIVQEYAARQQKILANALNYLEADGRLIYITCSVFAAENETVLQAAASGCTVLQQEVINGTTHHADNMYVAVLQRT